MYRDDFYYYFPFTCVCVYIYCPDRKYATPPHARGIYRRAGTDRDFTDLNAAAATAADVRDQWAPRPQEPTLAASTDFNPYRLQRWRWPTAAQSSVTRQRTTAHHRPSTIASPSCQPHNISIDVLHHNI